MNQAASIPFLDVSRRKIRLLASQHWPAIVGGGALALYGIRRRSALGLVMAGSGATLAYFAVRSNFLQRESVAHSSILVNCSPEQAFQFWRDFENLPRFMNHLESVSVTSDRRSRWIALGPMGARISWDAEIVNERANESISWRSLPGSDLTVNGSVEFRTAPANRGTIITAVMNYHPLAGPVGAAVAKLLGKDPSFLMSQDLRRMKALIEAGEIPTIEGQTHGPRDVRTGIVRALDPDRPFRREAGITEVIRAKRRIS